MEYTNEQSQLIDIINADLQKIDDIRDSIRQNKQHLLDTCRHLKGKRVICNFGGKENEYHIYTDPRERLNAIWFEAQMVKKDGKLPKERARSYDIMYSDIIRVID
jgi:hypothetical protein